MNHEADPASDINHRANLGGVGVCYEHRCLPLDIGMIDVVHGSERIQFADWCVTINLLKQPMSIWTCGSGPTLWIEIGPHRLP